MLRRPKQARSRETVDSILQAVVELVEKGEARELTTTGIAERAGVSVGSLYQYFPAKEAIFSALIEWYLNEERKLVQQALSSRGAQALEGAIDEMLTQLVALRKRNLRLEQALLKFFFRAGDVDTLNRLDCEMIVELEKALPPSNSKDPVAFLLYHLVRSTFLAITLQKPELYEDFEPVRHRLKRTLLALLS